MIGLRADEWDVILGGLSAFEIAEWIAIEKGCECNVECDPLIVNKGCYDQTQIDIIQDLYDKVFLIKKTMDYFERELSK